MSNRIVTRHISPYVALQGPERNLLPVPNPMASFEDTTHAYECGYRDGQKAAQPAAPAVKVKPLVWEYSEATYTADRETGRQEAAGLFWQAFCKFSGRSYTIMKLVDPRLLKGDKDSYRIEIRGGDQRFPTLEGAKEALNARHRARILAALEGGDA